MEGMSKVTGLSDIESTIVGFDVTHNLLIITYKNSNIDILKDGQVINISDIERKNIVGDKAIYGIYFNGDYAYLSCGFGIVVLDLLKYEIKDTYYIGPGGTSLQVNDVTSDGAYLYAATTSGVLRGVLNNPNLVDFNQWYTFLPADGLHSGNFTDAVTFNQQVLASKGDTVFQFDGTKWFPWLIRSGFSVHKMEVSPDKIVITQIGPAGTRSMIISTAGEMDSLYTGQPYQGINDNGTIWIADLYFGLVKYSNGNTEILYPNGPYSSKVFDLAVNSKSHNLYVAPGGYNASFGFTFLRDGFFTRIDNEWEH